jgi:hypothetical protein
MGMAEIVNRTVKGTGMATEESFKNFYHCL